MKLTTLLLTASLAVATLTMAQNNPPATSSRDVMSSLEKMESMRASSRVAGIHFENIGPTVMSGRVVDLEVNPQDPTEFYVGYASGGLWHTTNNGNSFVPIMDNAPTQNVGDLAMHWPSRTLYVGTGENNSSRSSYAGIGIYKTTDNGANWEYAGLPDSHHIGRMLINPANKDHVIVGVAGHLYSDNADRGVYVTQDGGKNWSKQLFVNNRSGVIDLAAAPGNFDVMYAAVWERDRKAWNFTGNGAGTGIYKSTDAGQTWRKISTASSGLPQGDGNGRMGLAVVDENTAYLVHDSQFRRKAEKKTDAKKGLTKDDFKSMTTSQLLALENKKLDTYLKQNGFQEKYRAASVKNLVRSGEVKPADLASYLEDANSLLFDTPVEGAMVFKTTDGGDSWKKTHDGYVDNVFYSYGYYFAQIRTAPYNADHVYIMGVPILFSENGGKDWKAINKENVHADHHALWINPNKEGHLINGNDGGINVSYDNGDNWFKNNQPAVGQFYAIAVDNETPYNVYGGLQDNGVWKGANNAPENRAWQQQGQYPWKSIMGGDGMQIAIDSRDANVVYTGYQFGNYYRLHLDTGDSEYIQPKHELGDTPYRFNWQTPVSLSTHNQDIVYFGANKLLRSMDQGNTWTAISGDLTRGGRKGNVAYGTLTTHSESPFAFGVIYTGSDDGKIYRTDNAGGNWVDVSPRTQELWVSRVVASAHDKNTVYATLNGYRWDDMTPYVFKSTNKGATWTNIGSSLPQSPVNVILEDPKRAGLLYVGTDNATYVSMNDGASWDLFAGGMPAVAVHDLKIQEREGHLLVGTHGRSIYRADINALQQYGESSALQIAPVASVRASNRWGSSFGYFAPTYEPSMDMTIVAPAAGSYKVHVMHEGKVIQEMTQDLTTGYNVVSYDLSINEKGKRTLEKSDKNVHTGDNGVVYIPSGTYTIRVTGSSGSTETELVVK